MRLLAVSGFLGVGKTTLIVQLAKQGIKKGLKVVILVNEAGEIGVDDQFMMRSGLKVREILGGCICCTLAGSLQTTLEAVEREFDPERVILEPSGVADPKTFDALVKPADNRHAVQLKKVTIVDPLRMEMMMAVLTPLITSQIQSAEWIIINKTDAATIEQTDFTRKTIGKLNPVAQTVLISAKNGLPEALAERLLA